MSHTIWGLILAGGASARMQHQDKGLLEFKGAPLIEHVIARIAPQVQTLVISANRNLDRYRHYTPRVVSDAIYPGRGPLAGIANALPLIESDLVLIVPCDTPFLPETLLARLHAPFRANKELQISVAHTGDRLQALTALMRKDLHPSLLAFLAAGRSKVQEWYATLNSNIVDFSDCAACFANINTPDQLGSSTRPVLGFAGYSGSGKTTLLEHVIPRLREHGVRTSLVKHAHHRFDIDHPGKDSYKLRKAGAVQTLVASRARWALMTETPEAAQEPQLAELLKQIDTQGIDLILVEGFKHESIPKIEVHRAQLGRPYLFPNDPTIIALASDSAATTDKSPPRIDLNDSAAVARFIVEKFLNRGEKSNES